MTGHTYPVKSFACPQVPIFAGFSTVPPSSNTDEANTNAAPLISRRCLTQVRMAVAVSE